MRSNKKLEHFLLGEGAVDFVLQQGGQMAAQRLGLRGEQVARARQVDRHDGLDASGPRR